MPWEDHLQGSIWKEACQVPETCEGVPKVGLESTALCGRNRQHRLSWLVSLPNLHPGWWRKQPPGLQKKQPRASRCLSIKRADPWINTASIQVKVLSTLWKCGRCFYCTLYICDELVTFPWNFGLDRSLTYLEKEKSKSKLLRYIFLKMFQWLKNVKF